jgi:hypothetical protein
MTWGSRFTGVASRGLLWVVLFYGFYYLGWDGGSLGFFKDVYVGKGKCYESVICFLVGGYDMFD